MTTLSWRYHNLACTAHNNAARPAGQRCVRTVTVTFDISVR
jgi:hypothetical protein